MSHSGFRELGIWPTNDFEAVVRAFLNRATSIDILGSDRSHALADWRELCEAIDGVAREIVDLTKRGQ
jgi:hypothetical protein